MSRDRITQLRISGLRAIADVTLDLNGLTVLVGDNGTGKSSILEALELLRLAASPVSFVHDVVGKRHGGLGGLLRRGADELRLEVTIEGHGARLVYQVSLELQGTSTVISSEQLHSHEDPQSLEPRTILSGTSSSFIATNEVLSGEDLVPSQRDVRQARDSDALMLPHLGRRPHPAFQRTIETLSGIEIHVPFETRPLWQQRELDLRKGPRWPSEVEHAGRLERYALNLANAFQQLRNTSEEAWNRVITRARMGLGDDVRNFRLTPAGRGNLELEVVLGSTPDQPMPVEYLSEGQLAYLAFIALVELDAGRSVLAFDEPELHLHPSLLARVVFMLEEAAERTPVILATHSDRLLDALEAPHRSVVLCDLDEHRAVRLRRPNEDKLARWLEDYRGFGSLRAEGYDAYVFDSTADSKGDHAP